MWYLHLFFFFFLNIRATCFCKENNLTFFLLAFLIVPMIRNHKWEWGPPTHQHHPALLCHRCTMPPQTQLRLLNLTGFSRPISLHPSPFKTTASLWITGKTQNVCKTYAEVISMVDTCLSYRAALASSQVRSECQKCMFYERLAPCLRGFSRSWYWQWYGFSDLLLLTSEGDSLEASKPHEMKSSAGMILANLAPC